MIRHQYVNYNGSQLHYAKTGNGEKQLLVFHGFGQDLSVFDYFARSLTNHYTFYIFDLYFHGNSSWAHDETPLEKKEWKETLKIFFEKNPMPSFSLAGFSLGGKFVLTTLESFPEKVKEIFLIAPDGIKTNFWYAFATYPWITRKFFKSMIFRPERFLSIARFLFRRGWTDPGVIRFAEYQMNTAEKRRRVYYSWIVFRNLTFNMRKIAKLMNQHGIRTVLIVGRYDKVIQPNNMKRLTNRLVKYRFEVLESGHSGLINQSLPYFIQS